MENIRYRATTNSNIVNPQPDLIKIIYQNLHYNTLYCIILYWSHSKVRNCKRVGGYAQNLNS